MPNDALLWNAPPPPPRVPRPAERLWTMRNGIDAAHAELRGHGEYGWEWHYYRDGLFLYGRLCMLRAQALACAEEQRQDLLKDGWTERHKSAGGSR